MRLSSALFAGAGVAAFVAILPFVSAFGAGLIASAAGCDLNEGTANTCLIAQVDVGPTLYQMFVMGWMFIFSFLYIPVAIALVVAGFVVLARGRGDSARNQKVGGVFWLLLVAGMISPIAMDIALGLLLLAVFFWSRQKRKGVAIENPKRKER